jgi:hypothetical protein
MVRPHKAAASPLCQVPTEPRTHRQDGNKKGQHHKAVVANGELVSPAGSSRYLLSGCASGAGAGEIQEVVAAAVVPVAQVGDVTRTREEPAADVKNANTEEQVRILCSFRRESFLRITTLYLYLCFGALLPLVLIAPPKYTDEYLQSSRR